MLMLYSLSMSIIMVLNIFTVATHVGARAARGVKPFQMDVIVALVFLFILNIGSVGITLYIPGEVYGPAVLLAITTAIISIGFFIRVCRRLLREYLWKKDKNEARAEQLQVFLRHIQSDCDLLKISGSNQDEWKKQEWELIAARFYGSIIRPTSFEVLASPEVFRLVKQVSEKIFEGLKDTGGDTSVMPIQKDERGIKIRVSPLPLGRAIQKREGKGES